MIGRKFLQILCFLAFFAIGVWPDHGFAQSDLGELEQKPTLAHFFGDSSIKSTLGKDFIFYHHPSQSGVAKYRFLVKGGAHGDEQVAARFVYWLAKRYQTGESLLNRMSPLDVEFDFLPVVNPDGFLQDQRANARGVNLNRNYDVLWGVSRENPGRTQFSEPETKAVKKLFEARNYTAAVDVHGYINWIVTPSEPKLLQEAGEEPTSLLKKTYAAWTSVVRQTTNKFLGKGYEVKSAGGLGDGGAFEDWAFWRKGALSVCLELVSAERFNQKFLTLGPRKDFDQTKSVRRSEQDSFLAYELYLFQVFKRAAEISDDRDLWSEAKFSTFPNNQKSTITH